MLPPAPVTSTTLPVKVLRQQAGVRWHGVAPQQVFDVELAKILHGDAATGQV